MTPIETWDEEIVADVPSRGRRCGEACHRGAGTHHAGTSGRRTDPAAVGVRRRACARRPVRPPRAAFGGFAPPTLDMSAEAIYARAMAQMEADAAAATRCRSSRPITDADAPARRRRDRVVEPAAPPGSPRWSSSTTRCRQHPATTRTNAARPSAASSAASVARTADPTSVPFPNIVPLAPWRRETRQFGNQRRARKKARRSSADSSARIPELISTRWFSLSPSRSS